MHTELIDYFEKNYSKYYNLKYENTVADIKKLQENLSARTTLMEYSLSDTVLYTMIITRNKYTVIRQSIDSSFNQLLNRYLSKFHNFDFSRQSLNDFTEFCWYSQSLYNILIAPAIKYISGNSLVIVPDGLLSYLPFETLIKDIPDEIPSGQYRYLNYLINYFEISYSYSATLFDQVNRKKKKTAIHELLAFAPEYTSDTDKQISVTGNYFRKKYRKNLHPIPGVYDEVKSIHKLISGEVYYGGEATEKNFLATAGYFDILHLAMHTVIDNYNPLYSKLIFTLDSDSLYDGYLNTSEVFGLNLKARMVVLSACSTGEGEFNNGEGVMSLARGFVYAGSPSIIMTMWEVEDKSGAELMKNFYKNLLRGQSKPKAMRNAKLTCIKKFRPENTHPFFWSSFVVMGNGQPLFINRKIVLRIFVLLIFAGAIAVIIFFLAGFCTNRKK
jgi:CHAT domain-containing protein